jgi:hypothetical protein
MAHMTPLEMIAAWRKGCSCASPGRPEECHACTVALIEAIERSLRAEAPHFELGRIWPGVHIGDEATATKAPIAPTPLKLEDV